jgi:hypothetical protein
MNEVRWSSLLAVLLCLGETACADRATWVRETPNGGVIAYPIQDPRDTLSAPARSEAMELIRAKCIHGTASVREGEIPRVTGSVDRAWRGQMSGDRLWAMEFSCKKD